MRINLVQVALITHRIIIKVLLILSHENGQDMLLLLDILLKVNKLKVASHKLSRDLCQEVTTALEILMVPTEDKVRLLVNAHSVAINLPMEHNEATNLPMAHNVAIDLAMAHTEVIILMVRDKGSRILALMSMAKKYLLKRKNQLQKKNPH